MKLRKILVMVLLLSEYSCVSEIEDEFYSGNSQKIRKITIPVIVMLNIYHPDSDSKTYVDISFKMDFLTFEKHFDDFISYLDKNVENNVLLKEIIEKSIDSKQALNSISIFVFSLTKYFSQFKENRDIAKKIQNFIEECFYIGQNDLENATLDNDDYKYKLETENANLKSIFEKINNTWKSLIKQPVAKNSSRYGSLIKLKCPISIPGGRFRESYYWDNYWVLKGYLASRMYKSALYIILNNMELIERFGYIPNGTRRYYLGRSQPPMFISMVEEFFRAQVEDLVNPGDIERIFNAMECEYNWWMTQRTETIVLNDKEYNLNLYRIQSDYPRLESLKEDIKTFKNFVFEKYDGLKVDDSKEFIEKYNENGLKDIEASIYSNLKSAAESGWDFSSRFTKENDRLYDICTNNVIPVDLNSILYHNEIILAEFSRKYMNDENKQKKYLALAEKRHQAINEVLWNDGCWKDYNYIEKSHRNDSFYFSNIFPMIYELKPPVYSFYSIIYKYKEYLFGYEGGIPASSIESSQQWDFPNVWAPHQELFISFLLKIEETLWALDVAKRFYKSVCEKYNESPKIAVFYEKYNCQNVNDAGSKGEYPVQTGFGWTNGVMASIISIFKDNIIESSSIKSNKILIYQEIENRMRHDNRKTFVK